MITRRDALKLVGAAAVNCATRTPGLAAQVSELAVAGAGLGGKNNVLFILCDQLNLRLLSCYGGPIHTPNLERLCRSGIRFDNAVCTYPLCSPNRASLVTGQYPHTHGIVYNVNNADYPEYSGPDTEQGISQRDNTLGKILYRAHYETHHYGKWHLDGDVLPYYPDPYDDQHQYVQEMAGVFQQVRRQPRSDWMQWYGWSLPVTVSDAMKRAAESLRQEAKGSPLSEFVSKAGRLDLPLSEVFDVRVADKTVERLESLGDQPFFLTASFNYPHDPNVVPAPFYDMVSPDKMEIPANFAFREARFESDWSRKMVVALGMAGLREMLRIYYAAVMLLDNQVGKVLDALERSGRAANTLVVFTTDHGDMAGGHGMFWKSTEAFYEDVVRVPLILSYPAKLAPGVNKDAVSSADIMPTILGLSGMPIPAGVEGTNLASALTGSATAARATFSFCERITPNAAHVRQAAPGMRGSFMVRGEQWKYISYSDGGEYMYDLAADPGETKNVAAAAQYADRKKHLIQALDNWKAETHCPAYA
jgi:arylsulfatase A-like enzyme